MAFSIRNLSDTEVASLLDAIPDKYLRKELVWMIRDVHPNIGKSLGKSANDNYVSMLWKTALKNRASKSAQVLSQYIEDRCREKFPEVYEILSGEGIPCALRMTKIENLYSNRSMQHGFVPPELLVRLALPECTKEDVETYRSFWQFHTETLDARLADERTSAASTLEERAKEAELQRAALQGEIDFLEEKALRREDNLNIADKERQELEEQLQKAKKAMQAALTEASHMESQLGDAKQMLSHQLVDALGCGKKEATELLNLCFRTFKFREEKDVVRSLVDQTVRLTAVEEGILEARWRAQKQEEIRVLTLQQEKLIHEIDAHSGEIAMLQEQALEKTSKLMETEGKVRACQELESQLTGSLMCKLSELRGNAASLVDSLLLLFPNSMGSASTQTIGESNARTGVRSALISSVRGSLKYGTQRPLEIKPNTVRNLLAGNLRLAGVSDEKNRGELALLLISAYASEVNLVLAGQGAEDVADALAASLIGTRPAVLDASLPLVLPELVEPLRKESLVRVESAFESDQLPVCLRLARMCPKTVFLFTAPFAQSLYLEPPGLFNAVLPIFTDFYVDVCPSVEGELNYIDAAPCIRKTMEFASGATSVQSFGALRPSIPLLAQRHMDQMLAWTEAAIDGFSAERMAIIGLITPILLSLGRRQVLLDALPSLPLKESDRDILNSFIRSET